MQSIFFIFTECKTIPKTQTKRCLNVLFDYLHGTQNSINILTCL